MRYVPRELEKQVARAARAFPAVVLTGPRNAGGRRELYHFRDEQGLEVDFLVRGRGGSVSLVECKATRTVMPAMAATLQRLADALKSKHRKGTRVSMFLVHEAPKAGTVTQAVAPGVRALPWQDFVGEWDRP